MTDSATRQWRHRDHFPDALASARAICPHLIEILGRPDSVVDLGGGPGAWCRALLDLGVGSVRCIDDPRLRSADLQVPLEAFLPWDLASSFPEAVAADWALCLEVAEHLPQAASRDLVSFLTASAPVVIFSASIPGQPGNSHINEQAPAFWKALFGAAGYRQLDLIRPRIIGQTELPYWYRQNLFVYADPARTEALTRGTTAFSGIPEDFELVHRRVLETYRNALGPGSVRTLLRQLPGAVYRAVRRRFGE